MSEDSMVALVQAALDHRGIDDTVLVAGQLQPRGRSGAMMAGGMIGADVGGDLGGEILSGFGIGLGMAAGSRAHEGATALPSSMLVGVSETTVYGMHARTRRSEPDRIVFAVPRAGLTARVHQRVNVRVLELEDAASGTTIELEGSRVPVTHSKDVIHVLSAAHGHPT